MSEKKTFKNEPSGQVDGYGIEAWKMSTGEIFSVAEWDMEVTFTRKETPLSVGDHIRDDRGDTAIVLAIDGDEVWLKYYGTYNFRATGNLDECTKISD